jgi:hypothetical protein
MEAVVFVAKFGALTLLFLAIVPSFRFLMSRFESKPLTIAQATSKILGTHLGRLRLLLIAAVVSLVLAMIYPGPALLLPSGATEKAREVGHHLLFGNNPQRPFIPSPPDTSTWFWGQAALLYLGLLIGYVVLALPNLLSSAIQAARSVSSGPTASSSRPPAFWAAVGAFIGVFVMYLRNKKPV